MPGFDVQVLDDGGHAVAPGTLGAIAIKLPLPPGCLPTLWNAEARFRESYLDTFPGYYETGDAGYIDDDGYLWLSDRKIDMIISGGVNIYPAEIEGVLGGHSLVADVTVIGIPNDDFGEEVKAVIVPQDGIAPDEALADTLRSFCREQLAGFKVPRSFDFTDELPRTGTGKVQKAKVRAPYWEGHDRAI